MSYKGEALFVDEGHSPVRTAWKKSESRIKQTESLFFYRISEIIRIMVIESECINESLHGSIISFNPWSYFCPFPHFLRHASLVASAELI